MIKYLTKNTIDTPCLWAVLIKRREWFLFYSTVSVACVSCVADGKTVSDVVLCCVVLCCVVLCCVVLSCLAIWQKVGTVVVAYRRGGFGVFKPPSKFRRFDKVEPDFKLSGKCLVFLFQHPN
jgi:hypothetical protein